VPKRMVTQKSRKGGEYITERTDEKKVAQCEYDVERDGNKYEGKNSWGLGAVILLLENFKEATRGRKKGENSREVQTPGRKGKTQ